MIHRIVSAMESKGDRVFRNGRHDLNIVGIRSVAKPDRFDDCISVFSMHGGEWLFWSFPATTDPGVAYLKNPINKSGTAILAPGQYRSAYRIGKHRGKYDALIQSRPVTVFRDGNMDGHIDPWRNAETGIYGINIHMSTAGEADFVGKHSAGCQVFKNGHDFEIFMAMARAGAAKFGNAFTYTLLEEVDLYDS